MAKGTQIVDRDAELKAQIKAQQMLLSKIKVSSKFISFKGGNIIIDKKVIPHAKTDVIVLGLLTERAYFPGAFDPEVRQSPACYAYASMEEDEDEMSPHEEAKDPQSEGCADCQWNKFGTADKGRGKACRESIRVALLPAQKNLAKADIWHARIPITSVPAFKDFANTIFEMGKPLYSVVAELSVVPDVKSFFKINWNPKKAVSEEDFDIAHQKAKTAIANIAFPYPDFEEEEQDKKKAERIKAKVSKRK